MNRNELITEFTLEEYKKFASLYFASEQDREIAIQQLQLHDSEAFITHVSRGLIAAMDYVFRKILQDLLMVAKIDKVETVCQKFKAFKDRFLTVHFVGSCINIKYNQDLIINSITRAKSAAELVEKASCNNALFPLGTMPCGGNYLKRCIVTHWEVSLLLEVTIGIKIDGKTVEFTKLPDNIIFKIRV